MTKRELRFSSRSLLESRRLNAALVATKRALAILPESAKRSVAQVVLLNSVAQSLSKLKPVDEIKGCDLLFAEVLELATRMREAGCELAVIVQSSLRSFAQKSAWISRWND